MLHIIIMYGMWICSLFRAVLLCIFWGDSGGNHFSVKSHDKSSAFRRILYQRKVKICKTHFSSPLNIPLHWWITIYFAFTTFIFTKMISVFLCKGACKLSNTASSSGSLGFFGKCFFILYRNQLAISLKALSSFFKNWNFVMLISWSKISWSKMLSAKEKRSWLRQDFLSATNWLVFRAQPLRARRYRPYLLQ